MDVQSANDYGRWQLPQKLEELSDGNSYPAVLREWELDYIEHLAPGEDSETCLCTHYPIREVCHILNLQNNNTAIVGNCCVKKFEKEAEAVNFVGKHKVFDALKRLQKDNNANANEELIEYAYSKGVLTEKEYKTYLEIWRNRIFTTAEARLIRTANEKIINHASSKAMREHIAKQAEEKARKKAAQAQPKPPVQNPVVPSRTFARLPVPSMGQAQQAVTAISAKQIPSPQASAVASYPAAPPRTFTQLSPMQQVQQPARDAATQKSSDAATPVAPKRNLEPFLAELRAQPGRVADRQIVREAYSQKILTEKDLEFYMKMVGYAGRFALSPSQQTYLSGLNKKILAQFKLNVATPSRSPVESTPRPATLVDRQSIVHAFNQGLIKEKDREFYLGLIQKKVTAFSEAQQAWMNDIHKRMRVEDERTEANSNPRPVKRSLTME